MYRARFKRIHFIGIGGSGMNGIAEVLVNLGYQVSGSDLRESDVTRRLAGLGAEISIGHDGDNVKGADCVVYSSAVNMENPEVVEAHSEKIPIIPRAEMLAELMRMKYGLVVAGTHGKTSTTSMLGAILAEAELDPTIVTGGKLNSIGAGAKLGSGEFMVAEADESDGSFLKLSPTIALVTNIDREHMDHYGDMGDVKRSYLDFMNKVPFYGCCVICIDHPVIQGLVPEISRRVVSFGLSAQADVHAENVVQRDGETSFDLSLYGEAQGRITLKSPGMYNVYNALAAIAAAGELDIEFDRIKAGLEGYSGVERRFQVRGVVGDVMVVDDYGHHPVEVKAVLAAAREGWKRRVVVVFQPHRYSRTADLFDDFLYAFNDADKLVLTDIYTAGEEPIEGVSAERLYSEIKEHGHKDVTYVAELGEVAGSLAGELKPGDMVITLGAGNVWNVGVELLRLLGDDNSGERSA